MHIPRILLVDDDPALLHCLCDLLTYRLRTAVVIVQASSDHVVADVTEGHYDVVVCDLKMPHQDGLAVIRHVKAVNPGQRIILITGCIDESIEQEAQQQGADAVLDLVDEPAGEFRQFGELLTRTRRFVRHGGDSR